MELPENAVNLTYGATYGKASGIADVEFGPGRLVWLKDDPPPELTLAEKLRRWWNSHPRATWETLTDEFDLVQRSDHEECVPVGDWASMVEDRDTFQLELAESEGFVSDLKVEIDNDHDWLRELQTELDEAKAELAKAKAGRPRGMDDAFHEDPARYVHDLKADLAGAKIEVGRLADQRDVNMAEVAKLRAAQLRPLDEAAVERWLRNPDRSSYWSLQAEEFCAEFGNPPMPTQEQIGEAIQVPFLNDAESDRLVELGILPEATE